MFNPVPTRVITLQPPTGTARLARSLLQCLLSADLDAVVEGDVFADVVWEATVF